MDNNCSSSELSKSGNVEQRCLVVAFAGLPNAGKSSLLNIMAGNRLSVVTPRKQTTRDVVLAITVKDNSQIIFVDTPGIFIPRNGRPLERKIVKDAWRGLANTDITCIVIDSMGGISENLKTTIGDITRRQEKVIFILNKVDLIRKGKLLKMTEELTIAYPQFLEVFMISAITGENVDKLRNYLLASAPEKPWLFNENETTNVSKEFMASEITREKLFLDLQQDLPYAIDVVTESWENFSNGSIKLTQTIRVLKNSQKAIVLGRSGSTLKRINISARKEMENFFGAKIHLFLFVQVKSNWLDEKL